MSEPYIGEIRAFGFNFAPRGWAFCDGALLPISQHTALFSILGTIYGGNGRTDFALPDFNNRLSMHHGNGPGLSPRQIGQRVGETTATLSAAQLPSHRHGISAASDPGELQEPSPARSLARSGGGAAWTSAGPVVAGAENLTATGGGQPHNNEQPFLAVNICIALVGVFPSRN